MAEIYADDLAVCVDCAQLIANGEVGDGTTGHGAKIAAQWGGHQLVLSGGEDSEPWFSWSRCDGCGSTLGGDRFEAAAFA